MRAGDALVKQVKVYPFSKAASPPESHFIDMTGKLYNAVAVNAAQQIADEVKGVREVYVRILSRIGSPIDQPQIASAAVVLEKGKKMSRVRAEVEGILDDQLEDIRDITNLILEKRVILF